MDLITGNSLTDLLDKALECPVCLEQLDSTARVLPCQHTFCRRCLLEIVHSRKELLCPECRVQCDLRVDELPPNILLIRLLEGIVLLFFCGFVCGFVVLFAVLLFCLLFLFALFVIFSWFYFGINLVIRALFYCFSI